LGEKRDSKGGKTDKVKKACIKARRFKDIRERGDGGIIWGSELKG